MHKCPQGIGLGAYGSRFAARIVPCLMAVVLGGTSAAFGQGWQPSKPVELVVGAGPGGGNDRIARNLQHIIQTKKLVPTTMVVLNKPGAGGAVGINYLNEHAGDGHYLMIQNPALVTNPLIGVGEVTYRDITPLVQLLADYVTLIGKTSLSYESGVQLLEALKADPKSLTIGLAPGTGTGVHLALAQVAQAVGIDPTALHIIPFATASEAITAMLGGDIDIVPTTPQNALSLIEANRVKAFGVTSPARLEGTLSKVPTWKEQGVDVVYNNWRAMVGPKNMTGEQIAYWENVFRQVSESDEWKQIAEKDLLSLDFHGGEEFASFIEKDNEVTEKLFGELGLLKK